MPIHTFHIKWRLTLTDTEGPNPNPTDPILTITNTGEGILQSGDIALVQSINQSITYFYSGPSNKITS